MQNGPVPSTTGQAVAAIAEELNLDPNVVDNVVQLFIRKIRYAMRVEMPFSIRGLGKLYLSYQKTPTHLAEPSKQSSYEGKIFRRIKFSPTDDMKAELHCWVHDFGIRDNTMQELAKLKIKPDELDKLRKKKILDEQRALGFRSDLLFDEVPESEKSFEKTLGKVPTVSEIMKRIGTNLDD